MEKVFGRKYQLGKTAVVKCTKCMGLMLASAGLKTKTCPYCGNRVDLRRAQTLAKASSAFEGSEILKKLKSQKHQNPKV